MVTSTNNFTTLKYGKDLGDIKAIKGLKFETIKKMYPDYVCKGYSKELDKFIGCEWSYDLTRLTAQQRSELTWYLNQVISDLKNLGIDIIRFNKTESSGFLILRV